MRALVNPRPHTRRSAEGDPRCVVGVRGDGRLDELDTDEAVDAGGDGQFAARVAAQHVREVAVEVGERLQESLGMPEPDPRDAGGVVGQRAHALRENRRAAGRVADDQVLRIFVAPLQARVVAEHPNAQAVLVAGGRHGRPHGGRRAVGQREPDGRVVEHPSSWDERAQLGRHAGGLESGDVAQQVKRMGADVADGAGRPTDVGIHAPLIDLRRRPARRVLCGDEPDPAEIAVADHSGGVSNHRVGRIDMGHSEDRVARPGDRDQFGRRARVVGQWLLAHHRDARFEEGLCDLEVGVVGGDHRDDVEASRGFLLGHLAVVGVDALDAEALRELSRRRWVAAENTCSRTY